MLAPGESSFLGLYVLRWQGLLQLFLLQEVSYY
jgi:hypothetical protein